ncbi:MAG: hypothetical protein C4576_23020 [Desulfobacteraceae bacterium]|nr:MAG: hypothetical protein C4576_23020 [Desulfobacteraceae bacterium]
MAIGHYIRAEKDRRKIRRSDREKIWSEIDRQISMIPKARKKEDPTTPFWYPDVELPLQFDALEVIAADCRRLLFPRSTAWYSVVAEVGDSYMRNFERRRIAGTPLEPMMFPGQRPMRPAPMIGEEPAPMKIDQESANTLCKAVLEHYHRMYDFRAMIDMFLAEDLKYGTAVGRVGKVRMARFSHSSMGVKSKDLMGPAFIPMSIKNVYLDDSYSSVMHEGWMLGPSDIRVYWQNLDDLKKAAIAGGSERGWRMDRIKNLSALNGPDDKNGQVELIEWEGDLVLPTSQGSIFLPNVIVTVACGSKETEPVRFRKKELPFRSYVSHQYFRDDAGCPYGSSPLIKGQPIQESAVEIVNDLLAACRMQGIPPIFYDRHDPNFAAQGGPALHPNARIPTDAPNSVEVPKIGDVNALMAALMTMVKQHENTTGSNDARRGQRLKSHTTAEAANIEASQGISRTDDFVTSLETGPMTQILYMEWEIIRETMKSAQPVMVDANGIEGWVNISAQDLPERVAFKVVGSEGAIEERQRAQDFMQASKFAIELMMASFQAAAAGAPVQPVPLNLEAMAKEGYEIAGISNPGRFVGAPAAVSGGVAPQPAIPGPVAGPQPAGPVPMGPGQVAA